jgi:hypothetical protein
MICMGILSFVPLIVDVLCGGASRATLGRLAHIVPMQWFILAVSVFASAFIASSMQFTALKTISAANAQPFSALQPLFAAVRATHAIAHISAAAQNTSRPSHAASLTRAGAARTRWAPRRSHPLVVGWTVRRAGR